MINPFWADYTPCETCSLPHCWNLHNYAEANTGERSLLVLQFSSQERRLHVNCFSPMSPWGKRSSAVWLNDTSPASFSPSFTARRRNTVRLIPFMVPSSDLQEWTWQFDYTRVSVCSRRQRSEMKQCLKTSCRHCATRGRSASSVRGQGKGKNMPKTCWVQREFLFQVTQFDRW